MQTGLTFQKGLKDAIPIALGYLSVSFAFGIASIQNGLPAWAPILISATNLTGTGQFVGMELICAGTMLAELALTLFIINLRYSLMSISLSQKLSDDITITQRLLIAFGNTDEIYAVSMQQNELLNFRYMLGMILCAYSGWVSGTTIGALASGLLPQSIVDALGIALYAMFIAIIIPPAKESKPIMKIVMISIAMSCAFYFIPALKAVSSGWVIIICGVVSSAIGAIFYPVGNEEVKENDNN